MIKSVLFFAAVLPFGGGEANRPHADWTRAEAFGLVLQIGPPTAAGDWRTTVSPVEVAGGRGTLTHRLGLVRDVELDVRDADAAAVAALLDLPAAVRARMTGRVGRVRLTIKGDALTLTATRFGGRVGELVSRIDATADLRTRAYKAKAAVLGGVLTAEGLLPEGVGK